MSDSEEELAQKQAELDEALQLVGDRETALADMESRLDAQQAQLDDQQAQLEAAYSPADALLRRLIRNP